MHDDIHLNSNDCRRLLGKRRWVSVRQRLKKPPSTPCGEATVYLLRICRTPDNMQHAIALPKKEFGAHWPRLFVGDSDGARCLLSPFQMTGSQPFPMCICIRLKEAVLEGPYALHLSWWSTAPCNATCEVDAIISDTECDSDVSLVFKLPFWIEEDDVAVDITDRSLSVTVRNELYFRRSFWRSRCNLCLPVCRLLIPEQFYLACCVVRCTHKSMPVGYDVS